MKNEALFRTGSVWKSIFSMAVPSIIIILVMVLYNMADMFFVGCLGDTAQVAAVSVVGPVFSILAAVATMLGAGSSAIIARCFGAGEIEQGKICSSLCFWTSFFLGVLVSIGLLVGRVPLLGMLGSNAEIFPYAERYLQVLALGAPCFILSNSMAMLVRAEGAVKEGMIGNLLGTLVNCIFDPLFILVLNFGVSGAAAASVLGNLVATACYLRYIVKHGTVLTVDFRPALKKPQMLGELLAIGLPNGISSLLAGFASSFSNRLLVTHGTAAVAAMAAAGKTTMVISMIHGDLYGLPAASGVQLRRRRRETPEAAFEESDPADCCLWRSCRSSQLCRTQCADQDVHQGRRRFPSGNAAGDLSRSGQPGDRPDLSGNQPAAIRGQGKRCGGALSFAAGPAADPATVPDECALRRAGHCGGAPDSRRWCCGYLCGHPAALAPGIGRKNGGSMIYCFYQ